MDATAEKARDILLSIAEDEEADDDTRIRAACAILDVEKFVMGREPVETK